MNRYYLENNFADGRIVGFQGIWLENPSKCQFSFFNKINSPSSLNCEQLCSKWQGVNACLNWNLVEGVCGFLHVGPFFLSVPLSMLWVSLSLFFSLQLLSFFFLSVCLFLLFFGGSLHSRCSHLTLQNYSRNGFHQAFWKPLRRPLQAWGRRGNPQPSWFWSLFPKREA